MQENLRNAIEFFELIRTYSDEIVLIFSYCLMINVINWTIFRSLFNVLGIIPRNIFGLMGIFFSPILHGDFKHFISNALPLYILLIIGLSLANPLAVITIVVFTHILTAAGIWFLARPGVHIGASGIVCSLYGWILTTTYNEPTLFNIIILFVIFIYMGGILAGLIPSQSDISWEGHLIGFLSGCLGFHIEKSHFFINIQDHVSIFVTPMSRFIVPLF